MAILLGIRKHLVRLYMRLSTRYGCYIVTTQEDLLECYALRKLIFAVELKRVNQEIEFSPGSKDVLDKKSQWIACKDLKTNKIVGTCRVTNAGIVSLYEKLKKDYRLDLVPDYLLTRSLVYTRMSVLKEYRKSIVSLLLMDALYTYALKAKSELMLSVTEPSVYEFYNGYGFRPLAKIQQSEFGGFRAPIFLIVHDYVHLKKIDSPYYRLASRAKFPASDKALQWYQSSYLKNLERTFGLGKLDYQDSSVNHVSLMEGLSEQARKGLMRNSVSVRCKKGEYIFKAGAKDRHIGYVRRGALEVIVGDTVIYTIRPGEIFGEMAYVLNIPRTLDLRVAQGRTEIVLFSITCINRIKDTRDLVMFWRNFSKLLALKMLNMNNKIGHLQPHFAPAGKDAKQASHEDKQ